eukprot:symbB.v1.2.031902.t1/scaffold3746.1/size51030/2
MFQRPRAPKLRKEAGDVKDVNQPFELEEMISLERPALYVVSTPIGNLGDISLRALRVLREADALFAEDTRTTGLLLSRLDVDLGQRPLLPCHTFNEEQAGQSILRRLCDGQSVALVSDAGTPLISDPGFAVLRTVHSEGFRVHCVPGACALVAALSVAGLPCSSVLFGGFLPPKGEKKLSQLRSLLQQAASSTLVLYEAPHRLVNTLEMLQEIESEEVSRELAICRELTKRYETILRGTVGDVLKEVKVNPDNQKGEFVILIGGCGEKQEKQDIDPTKVLRLLRAELPESRAVSLTSKICGVPKKSLSDLLRNSRISR